MFNLYIKKRHGFLLFLVAILVFAGCQDKAVPESTAISILDPANDPKPNSTSQISEKIPDEVTQEFAQMILSKYRPENATKMPDLSGNISDIRITLVPREYIPPTSGNATVDHMLKNTTYLQIYYGYQKDGQWYDIPCENYDLKQIFDFTKHGTGFEAAGKSHIVKIGQYLLVCVQYSSGDYSQADLSCEFIDNLGSKPIQYFEEYYTAPRNLTELTESQKIDYGKSYGYLKENLAAIPGDGQPLYIASSAFDLHYYLVLDYASLPKDYELLVIFWHGDSNHYRRLTYNDIVALIEE